MSRQLFALLFLCLCLIALVFGFFFGPKVQNVIQAQFTNPLPSAEEQAADLDKVKQLLAESKAKEAAPIIQKYQSIITNQNPKGKEWLELLIDTSTQLKDINELLLLYQFFPSEFDNREEASILIATGFLLQGNIKSYDELREKWKDKETLKGKWSLLNANKLSLDNRSDEAIRYLDSLKLTGEDEIARLVMLARLNFKDNPKEAWKDLSEAVKDDPSNAYLNVYRAAMLEMYGNQDWALEEYVTAVRKNPKDLILRDLLGSYLIRQNQLQLALQLYASSLKPPTNETMWIKAWFWNRVYTPIKFDWKNEELPPKGKYADLLQYLIHLPPEKFWDDTQFEKVPNGKTFFGSEEITFWLRLFQSLKEGKDVEAEELLRYNPFRNRSINSPLALNFAEILQYRRTGSLNLEAQSSTLEKKTIEFTATSNTVQSKNPFFQTLNDLAKKEKEEPIPQDIVALLKSKNAFTASLLSTGWLESALNLSDKDSDFNQYPEWVSLVYTSALLLNQGVDASLAFAVKQKQTPKMILLQAQILAQAKKWDEALEKINPYIQSTDEVGGAAALLAASIYIEKKDFAKAREIINSQPILQKSYQGTELLARMALLEGNGTQAEEIYSKVQDQSIEAKSFLAKQAFLKKDYKKARELTEQILIKNPNIDVLRTNLEAINKAEKEAQGVNEKNTEKEQSGNEEKAMTK